MHNTKRNYQCIQKSYKISTGGFIKVCIRHRFFQFSDGNLVHPDTCPASGHGSGITELSSKLEPNMLKFLFLPALPIKFTHYSSFILISKPYYSHIVLFSLAA